MRSNGCSRRGTLKQLCARRKTRVATPSRSQARSAGNELGVVLFVALASALPGCGSKEDLIIGRSDFVLARRDEFDELDLSYWELATHTFEDNLAWFTADNAAAEGGQLLLTISLAQTPATPDAGVTPKPYAAAELRTKVPFLYGRFRARARLAPGTGIINAFWGFYDRYATGGQVDNQIVTETVSTPDYQVRYAVVVPEGAPEPQTEEVPFDPSESFHVLGYDWTPTEVRFYLDGAIGMLVTGDAVQALTEHQRLVLSAYPSRAGWAGAFDAAILPVVAAYDWVEIHEYTGPRP